MYRIKGSHAYSHGCYIRPGEYVDLWRAIRSNAAELGISVSEYISHSMHLLLTGRAAKYGKLNNTKAKRRVAS